MVRNGPTYLIIDANATFETLLYIMMYMCMLNRFWIVGAYILFEDIFRLFITIGWKRCDRLCARGLRLKCGTLPFKSLETLFGFDIRYNCNKKKGKKN